MNGDAGPSPRLTGEAPILLTGLVERLRELLTADGALDEAGQREAVALEARVRDAVGLD